MKIKSRRRRAAIPPHMAKKIMTSVTATLQTAKIQAEIHTRTHTIVKRLSNIYSLPFSMQLSELVNHVVRKGANCVSISANMVCIESRATDASQIQIAKPPIPLSPTPENKHLSTNQEVNCDDVVTQEIENAQTRHLNNSYVDDEEDEEFLLRQFASVVADTTSSVYSNTGHHPYQTPHTPYPITAPYIFTNKTIQFIEQRIFPCIHTIHLAEMTHLTSLLTSLRNNTWKCLLHAMITPEATDMSMAKIQGRGQRSEFLMCTTNLYADTEQQLTIEKLYDCDTNMYIEITHWLNMLLHNMKNLQGEVLQTIPIFEFVEMRVEYCKTSMHHNFASVLGLGKKITAPTTTGVKVLYDVNMSKVYDFVNEQYDDLAINDRDLDRQIIEQFLKDSQNKNAKFLKKIH